MPLSRRQVYRRRRITVFGALAILLAAAIYGTSTLTAAVPATAATLSQPTVVTQPAVQPVWPGFGSGAVGAVGFEGLLGANGDPAAVVPIASITKLITALVVLDAQPITPGEEGASIEFTESDVDIYYDQVAQGASVAPVRAGLVLTEKQALTMMLLPSAGNYSESLATWAYGSVDAYLAAASAWLAAHNLTSTHVADTSGLSDSSVSSTADLVELAKLAVADSTIMSIVGQKTAEIPGIGTIKNTNKMLGTNGIDGLKTGTTTAAGACLLFSGDYQVGSETVTLVGVMLGGEGMEEHGVLNESIAALVGSVVPGFREVPLTTAGETYASYTTEWGTTASAVSAEDASVLVWSDTPIAGVAEVQTLRTAEDGDTVGALTFTVGQETIEVPLTLSGAVEDPGMWWRLGHPGELAG